MPPDAQPTEIIHRDTGTGIFPIVTSEHVMTGSRHRVALWLPLGITMWGLAAVVARLVLIAWHIG